MHIFAGSWHVHQAQPGGACVPSTSHVSHPVPGTSLASFVTTVLAAASQPWQQDNLDMSGPTPTSGLKAQGSRLKPKTCSSRGGTTVRATKGARLPEGWGTSVPGRHTTPWAADCHIEHDMLAAGAAIQGSVHCSYILGLVQAGETSRCDCSTRR